uniref:Uncharacterized protein n=1 Tax=Anguilla anguilla TaxID=7936 RepID=A0A0E9PH82_ANGAN
MRKFQIMLQPLRGLTSILIGMLIQTIYTVYRPEVRK